MVDYKCRFYQLKEKIIVFFSETRMIVLCFVEDDKFMGKIVIRRLLIIFCMFLCTTTFTFADESTENNENTIIQTGWVSIDGHMQWYDENGVPVIGWKNIDGSIYYFDVNAYMVTGINNVDNKYYLFNDHGILISQSGWVFENGSYYWVQDDNSIYTSGWKNINGETYFFNNQGVMVTGKYSINGNWYFFEENNSGKLVKSGWHQAYDGLWHYVADESILANSCWKLLFGQYYYFDQDSNMYTGWLLENGKYYYLANNGPMVTGWALINGNWYYMNSSGERTIGWQYINGHWYYLNEDGVMQTGWLMEGNNNYYLSDSGAMITGWLYLNGYWYYMNPSGQMSSGWQYIGYYWYYFGDDGNGIMKTGWQTINGSSYYLKPNGAMATGFTWVDGKYIYFNGSGIMTDFPASYYLGVPNYNQFQEGFPSGCEAVSLFQAMQYKGYLGMISLSTFVDSLPISSDPFSGFAGNPRSTYGQYSAIFPPALANWGNIYARGKVFDISGSSLDDLLGEISQGNPVVAYVTTYYTEPIWMNYPFGPNLYNNHAVTLNGYDYYNHLVHVSDPISGSKWLDMFSFANIYNSRKYAVVVR